MSDRIRVLLQCTIPYTEDDWHVGRFSLLAEQLRTVADVVARNREPAGDGSDPILSTLGESQFDVVWLLDGEGYRSCDSFSGNAEAVHVSADLPTTGSIIDGVVQFGAHESR